MAETVLRQAEVECNRLNYDVLTTELVLKVILERGYLGSLVDEEALEIDLNQYFEEMFGGDVNKDGIETECNGDVDKAEDLMSIIELACEIAFKSNRNELTVKDFLLALAKADAEKVYATGAFFNASIDREEVISRIIDEYRCDELLGCTVNVNTKSYSLDTSDMEDEYRENLSNCNSNEMQGIKIMTPFGAMVVGINNVMMNQPGEMNEQSENEDDSIEEGNEVDKKFRSLLSDIRYEQRMSNIKYVGQDDVLEQTFDQLCKLDKGNVMYIGEAGVGKTALIKGMAELMNRESKLIPAQLRNAYMFGLDAVDLVAGSKFRGEFEQKAKAAFNYMMKLQEKSGRAVILCIDNIHNMVGAGAGVEDTIDASGMIKKYIENGKFKVVGTTSYDDYRKKLEDKKAFAGLFSSIVVQEPSIDCTKSIIENNIARYMDYHCVEYKRDAINSIIELSDKYITDRRLPSKAFEIIDECGAYANTHGKNVVDIELAEEILSRHCTIPVTNMRESDEEKVKELASNMKIDVIGQDEAIHEIERAIRISKAGLNDDNKPVASLLFVGPTGTGKTETARSLAKNLGISLVKFDMSEFADSTSVTKFTGSSAGYVGYDDGSLLIKEIKKHPSCVLLLDEIEKADSHVFDTLLQIMDDATLTDSKGNKASFRNVVLIMTSNAGASKIGKKMLGFSNGIENSEIGFENIDSEIKNIFKPEFRNRLSRVVKFNGINEEMAVLIAKKLIRELEIKVKSKGRRLIVSEDVYKNIAKCGVSLETGAREMQRYINTYIKDALSDAILFGNKKELKIKVAEEKIKVV